MQDRARFGNQIELKILKKDKEFTELPNWPSLDWLEAISAQLQVNMAELAIYWAIQVKIGLMLWKINGWNQPRREMATSKCANRMELLQGRCL